MGVFETLDTSKQQLIEEHLRLAIEANRRVNLTRIDSFEEGKILHIEDSLSGLKYLDEAPDGLYGDIGSGGGFPGLTLAIATGRKTVLIDSRKKKMDEMEKIIQTIGLSDQVETYAGRAELLARKQTESFAVMTARALSQLSVILELASPLLEQDGVLICYKAQLQEAELADARRVQPLVGMNLEKDEGFLLNGEYQRRILTFRKQGKPRIKLPRLEGQAQKHPL